MNETLVINGQDFSKILASYKVTHIKSFSTIITTLDGTEHPMGEENRTEIVFKLYAAGGARMQQDYRVLNSFPLVVKFSDPDRGDVFTKRFRCMTDISKTFEMKSPLGFNIYSSGEIRLRCLEVD